MAKFFIGILVGILVGGALVFFFLGGAPRAARTPGEPVRPPDPNGVPPGTAQIVLREDFFNTVLQTIFRDMNSPSFPMGLADSGKGDAQSYALAQSGGCASVITILPEGSGVRTGMRFENNKLAAPIAFSGSYSSPFGCLNFTGWAQTNVELRFDTAQQNVFGQINVETVNLDGVSPLLSGFVTPVVQATLNSRVNPIQIIQGRQIALNVPIAATQGNLQASVKDVRSDVKDNALNLYAIYEFSGQKAASTPTP
jgi:hypothetical protein